MKKPFQNGIFGPRPKGLFAERLERIGSGASLGNTEPDHTPNRAGLNEAQNPLVASVGELPKPGTIIDAHSQKFLSTSHKSAPDQSGGVQSSATDGGVNMPARPVRVSDAALSGLGKTQSPSPSVTVEARKSVVDPRLRDRHRSERQPSPATQPRSQSEPATIQQSEPERQLPKTVLVPARAAEHPSVPQRESAVQDPPLGARVQNDPANRGVGRNIPLQNKDTQRRQTPNTPTRPVLGQTAPSRNAAGQAAPNRTLPTQQINAKNESAHQLPTPDELRREAQGEVKNTAEAPVRETSAPANSSIKVVQQPGSPAGVARQSANRPVQVRKPAANPAELRGAKDRQKLAMAAGPQLQPQKIQQAPQSGGTPPAAAVRKKVPTANAVSERLVQQPGTVTSEAASPRRSVDRPVQVNTPPTAPEQKNAASAKAQNTFKTDLATQSVAPVVSVAEAAPLSGANSTAASLRKNLRVANTVSDGVPSDADRALEEAPISAVRSVCRRALGPVSLFSLVINLLMLTGPLFMLQVYDRALPSGSVPTLVILFLLVSVLYIFFALLEGVRGRMFIRLGTRIDEILHRPLYRTTLDVVAQNSPSVGSNPLRDLDGIRTYISGPGPAAFFDVPWVPVYIGLIFVLHPLLGMFATFAAVLLVVVAIINKKSTNQGHADSARAIEAAQRFAEDGGRQAPEIQALGMTETLINKWSALKAESRRMISTVSDRAGLLGSMSKSMRLYFQSAMLGLGAWLAIEQAISAGMIIAATIIMSRALAPIEQIVQQWNMLVGAQRSWGRIKLMFESVSAQKRHSTTLPMPSGAVQVAALACFIDGSQKPILAGINFELEPGAGLGIIGPSGAGKSTLIKALLGIWPKVRGEVRLDGATHDQWDRTELGRSFGYLPQGAALLSGTIAQNISRFEENPSSDTVLQAARVTGAHRLAISFENGYDTLVGPGGVQLSAGQVQRIALARAIYDMPTIVVLDEPYSNLDADGEQALTESIKTLRAKGSTVIVVAHRASALNALDTVLCLRDGGQAFYGPKDEVLRAMTRAVAGDEVEQKQIGQKQSNGPIVRQVKVGNGYRTIPETHTTNGFYFCRLACFGNLRLGRAGTHCRSHYRHRASGDPFRCETGSASGRGDRLRRACSQRYTGSST